jgi:hypothetical protein
MEILDDDRGFIAKGLDKWISAWAMCLFAIARTSSCAFSCSVVGAYPPGVKAISTHKPRAYDPIRTSLLRYRVGELEQVTVLAL